MAYRTRSELLLERYTTDLEVEPGSADMVQFATSYNIYDKPLMTGKLIILGERMELRYEYNSKENRQTNGQMIPEVSPLKLTDYVKKKESKLK